LIRAFQSAEFRENIYTIDDGINSMILDPGEISNETAANIVNTASPLVAIVLTHGHFDHFAGIPKIVELSNPLPIFLSEVDFQNIKINNLLRFLAKSQSDNFMPEITRPFSSREFISIQDRFKLEKIETPGHTDGSVCFLRSGTLFSGDTLLARKPGPAYWPDANTSKLENSIKRLRVADFEDVLPGHGKSFKKEDILWDSYEH
jgi:glyoxylase-like metal-dependent hydrolase (beta-lactamase superfamily II)